MLVDRVGMVPAWVMMKRRHDVHRERLDIGDMGRKRRKRGNLKGRKQDLERRL